MVLREEESVLIREVSLFQGLKSTVLGEEESVLIIGRCPYFKLKSTQTWYLGVSGDVLYITLCAYSFDSLLCCLIVS